MLCYPVVRWEDQACSSTSHPINVESVRQHQLRWTALDV